MRKSTRKRIAPLMLTLASLLGLCAGCEVLTQSVVDGVADFIESTTANLLEQAFPLDEEV